MIYARYSSDRQTEQSIEGQVRVCNDYAERNDILIVNQYVDRATTGTNDNRDAFQQMMKDSDKKAWDYVLVCKIIKTVFIDCKEIFFLMTRPKKEPDRAPTIINGNTEKSIPAKPGEIAAEISFDD